MRIHGAYWVPILVGLTGGCVASSPGEPSGATHPVCEVEASGACSLGCEKDGLGGCEPLPPPPALEDGGVSEPEPDTKPDRKPPIVVDGGTEAPPSEEPPAPTAPTPTTPSTPPIIEVGAR